MRSTWPVNCFTKFPYIAELNIENLCTWKKRCGFLWKVFHFTINTAMQPHQIKLNDKLFQNLDCLIITFCETIKGVIMPQKRKCVFCLLPGGMCSMLIQPQGNLCTIADNCLPIFLIILLQLCYRPNVSLRLSLYQHFVKTFILWFNVIKVWKLWLIIVSYKFWWICRPKKTKKCTISFLKKWQMLLTLVWTYKMLNFFKIWLKEKLYKVFLIKIVTINTVSQFCFESCWPF